MKTMTIALAFLCMSGLAFAQFSTDTIFFSSDWKESEKEGAVYYRLYHRETNYLYHVVDYYLDGTIQMKGDFSSIYPERKDGKFSYYSKEGKLTAECFFVVNKLNGEYKIYENEKLSLIKTYKDHVMDGELTAHDETGAIRRREKYTNGEFVSGKCYSNTGSEIAYFPREQAPEYIGGKPALYNYLKNHIKYPKDANYMALSGDVLIQFTISSEGIVKDPVVLKSTHPIFDEEAMRVIQKMSKWTPGKLEGVPTEMKYELPIQFKF